MLLAYIPVTCNAEARMLYAGAKELMRNTAQAGRVMDIDSAEDLAANVASNIGGQD